MMTCFGISYTGIITGITITGTSHTQGIMILGIGLMILGSMIPGMDLIITAHTIMQAVITFLHITTLTPFTFPVTEGLITIHLTAG